MTELVKNKLGIALMTLMTFGFLYFFYTASMEFYVSKYGQNFKAKVLDVSNLCRTKRKFIVLLVDNNIEKIRVYGIKCLRYKYRLNDYIDVRKNKKLGIIVLPNNFTTVRLILFAVLFSASMLGVIELVRQRRKLKYD